MRYVTNCPISLKGDRVEAGVEIEVSMEDAARLGADISPAAGQTVAEERAEPVPVTEMSYDQLKAQAKELELSQAGSKADLIERITLHLQGKVETEMAPHIVTEDDLIANPALAAEGVKVGDEIMLPKEVTDDID